MNIDRYKDKHWLQSESDKGVAKINVARKCNVTLCAIHYYAKRFGISFKRWRKYRLDEKFFDEIDSEFKAYILGFIGADGYIDVGERTLCVKIQTRDRPILAKFAKYMKSNSIIRSRKQGLMVELCLCSCYMVESIAKYGIVRNKTRTLNLPDIDPKFMLPYLRGYFDGDGYIGRQAVLISASTAFKDNLLKYLSNNYKFHPHVVFVNGAWRLTFNKNATQFMKDMYTNSQIHLHRKMLSYRKFWACRNTKE